MGPSGWGADELAESMAISRSRCSMGWGPARFAPLVSSEALDEAKDVHAGAGTTSHGELPCKRIAGPAATKQRYDRRWRWWDGHLFDLLEQQAARRRAGKGTEQSTAWQRRMERPTVWQTSSSSSAHRRTRSVERSASSCT